MSPEITSPAAPTARICSGRKLVLAAFPPVLLLLGLLFLSGQASGTGKVWTLMEGDLSTPNNRLHQDTVNQPELVRPEANGTLRLTAETGRAIGPDIKYMPEWRAFGWFTAADRVEWEAEVKKRGHYDVFLEWSVSDEEAGKPFLFEAGKQQLKGVVSRTGSWETFRTEKVGRLRLSPGRQKLVFQPGSAFGKGALLDLREVQLVPVK